MIIASFSLNWCLSPFPWLVIVFTREFLFFFCGHIIHVGCRETVRSNGPMRGNSQQAEIPMWRCVDRGWHSPVRHPHKVWRGGMLPPFTFGRCYALWWPKVDFLLWRAPTAPSEQSWLSIIPPAKSCVFIYIAVFGGDHWLHGQDFIYEISKKQER